MCSPSGYAMTHLLISFAKTSFWFRVPTTIAKKRTVLCSLLPLIYCLFFGHFFSSSSWNFCFFSKEMRMQCIFINPLLVLLSLLNAKKKSSRYCVCELVLATWDRYMTTFRTMQHQRISSCFLGKKATNIFYQKIKMSNASITRSFINNWIIRMMVQRKNTFSQLFISIAFMVGFMKITILFFRASSHAS